MKVLQNLFRIKKKHDKLCMNLPKLRFGVIAAQTGKERVLNPNHEIGKSEDG